MPVSGTDGEVVVSEEAKGLQGCNLAEEPVVSCCNGTTFLTI
jgi:hypothetical protein